MDQNLNNVFDKTLTEKQLTVFVIKHLQKYGYLVTSELVLDQKYFDIKKITGKKVTKVRIDIAAYKDNKITFIEVENGLWLTHPLLYRNFANKVFLACPNSLPTTSDAEQIELARTYGIGIISLTINGSIKTVLKPIEKEIDPAITKAISNLIVKKFV